MKRIALFRARQIFMPTIVGWLFITVIITVTCLLVMLNIYSFLAQNEPVGARVLVVEGWLAPIELEQAADTFNHGDYELLVTTGGPILSWPELASNSNYAKVAADYLALHGVPRNLIFFVPTPSSAQERTFLSAVVLRNSAHQLGFKLDSLDLFSSGAHSRRSRMLFQLAFGQNVRVGVLAARPVDYDPEAWWRTSSGVESIIFQSIALLWANCFFWPGPQGSQQELWSDH